MDLPDKTAYERAALRCGQSTEAIPQSEGIMKKRVEKYQPPTLPQRIVNGHLLYSHAVATTGQRLVFISGQLARNEKGETVGRHDMRAQIRQVGENLRAALTAAGASLDDLVKTTTFVTDIDEFFKHVDLRAEYLGPALPASTTVEVRRLSHPDLMVEIEAIAMTDT